MVVSKTEIVERINQYPSLFIGKSGIEFIVDKFIENIKEEIAKGNDVKIRGFLTFTNVKVAERKRCGFTSANTVLVPEHTEPKCRFGKKFRKEVSDALDK